MKECRACGNIVYNPTERLKYCSSRCRLRSWRLKQKEGLNRKITVSHIEDEDVKAGVVNPIDPCIHSDTSVSPNDEVKD